MRWKYHDTAASPSVSAGVTLSERPVVQNNGGHFLGLDDYVFYREYGEDSPAFADGQG